LTVLDAIAENLGGVACLVVSVLWVALLFLPVLRQRVGLKRALRDPTWSGLTEGALTDAHRGELWSFWAGGGTGRKSEHGAKPTNLVAIDEVAIVFVLLQVRPRSTRRAWLRRADVPVLVVRRVWHGAVIIDPVSGLNARVRAMKVGDVASRLEDLGWRVEVEDRSAPAPSDARSWGQRPAAG
jgi:hypothetical protein